MKLQKKRKSQSGHQKNWERKGTWSKYRVKSAKGVIFFLRFKHIEFSV